MDELYVGHCVCYFEWEAADASFSPPMSSTVSFPVSIEQVLETRSESHQDFHEARHAPCDRTKPTMYTGIYIYIYTNIAPTYDIYIYIYMFYI